MVFQTTYRGSLCFPFTPGVAGGYSHQTPAGFFQSQAAYAGTDKVPVTRGLFTSDPCGVYQKSHYPEIKGCK
jgi:hypothetical protein